MINLQQLGLIRGQRTLFDNVNITLFAQQKIGLVGSNGSGKSSLFAMLLNQLEPTSGEISFNSDLVVAHVAQETPALDMPAVDYVLQGDAQVYRLGCAIKQAEADEDYERLAELHLEFSEIDGYSYQAKASQLLDGLGFQPQQITLPVASFSGGWRMRLNLAQALMTRSDILLLDEPTNHLDVEAIFWLEKYLLQYQGTLIVISHDREFLDNIVEHIIHIDSQAMKMYRGNYSSFETERALQLSLQQAMYVKQQKKIKHMSEYVERFRYKASKARQAQSRLKAIERMDKVAAVQATSPFQFEFITPKALPNSMITVRDAAFGYHDATVLRKVNLQIMAGDRIGLLGANGAGKSTLIKGLMGELACQSGEVHLAKNLRIGYFAQHQLDELEPTKSALAHLQKLAENKTTQECRSYLGGFAFNGDMALSPVGNFSGGERARLALALIIWQRPGLLLLDEPSNHLDLEMRNALSLALQNYEGALVLISHDRYLLRTTTDTLINIDQGLVSDFDGEINDYRSLVLQAGSKTASKKVQAKPRQAPVKVNNNRLTQIEKKLSQLHASLDALNTKLADPELYQAEDQSSVIALTKEQRELQTKKELLEAEWLAACEA